MSPSDMRIPPSGSGPTQKASNRQPKLFTGRVEKSPTYLTPYTDGDILPGKWRISGVMLDFLKRLFGNKAPNKEGRRVGSSILPRLPTSAGERSISASYFATMQRMREAISKHNFESAACLVRENLRQIPGWVRETQWEYGSFDIGSIPALEQGGTILALADDEAGLAEMQQIVSSVPELKPWDEEVDRHRQDRRLFKAILEVVASHPNCLQTDVKKFIGEADGRRVANLLSYLEKAGKIARIKAGRTYKIMLVETSKVPTPVATSLVRSRRSDRKPPKLKEIDISSLAYVPLPRSPLRWEEAQIRRAKEKESEVEGHFEVRDADWHIASIEKIPLEDRPDPAFRQMYPNSTGMVVIDDLGKANGLGEVKAAALRYDRAGNLVAKAGLRHGVYRLGVHPLGRGLIAMSRDCVVHAYDEHFKLLFETALGQAPEVIAARKRFGIREDQLKNHIRCVALSQNATRYLFTVVDQAWCVDVGGKGVWGAKLPVKEDWTRITTPSSSFCTSAEVNRALDIMKLSFPITPEDVKRRYRELAKQWHPDLSPGDPRAEKKMKALNMAAEALTGVDVSALPRYTGASFMLEIERMEFEESGIKCGITVGFQGGEVDVADWIYAASFAANVDSTYLAGYSGRVVLVDETGAGVRVYDISSVPRRILDTGDYLYLLTDTRLYVLRGGALHTLVDTFDGGELIIARTGFGLLEKKRLRWFSKEGSFLGSVVSKNPIRRVYSITEGMVVETRQRRAIVRGIRTW